MLRVAFASDDNETVNLHFGAAEQFILYDVSPGEAQLVGIGRFDKAIQKGVNAERRPDESSPVNDPEKMTEDKVISKIDFLRSCAGVYAAKVGTSSIKRLLEANIQPIIVNKGFPIIDLLNEVSLALVCGGLSWIDNALANPKALEAQVGVLSPGELGTETHKLITSIDDLS